MVKNPLATQISRFVHTVPRDKTFTKPKMSLMSFFSEITQPSDWVGIRRDKYSSDLYLYLLF